MRLVRLSRIDPRITKGDQYSPFLASTLNCGSFLVGAWRNCGFDAPGVRTNVDLSFRWDAAAVRRENPFHIDWVIGGAKGASKALFEMVWDEAGTESFSVVIGFKVTSLSEADVQVIIKGDTFRLFSGTRNLNSLHVDLPCSLVRQIRERLNSLRLPFELRIGGYSFECDVRI